MGKKRSWGSAQFEVSEELREAAGRLEALLLGELSATEDPITDYGYSDKHLPGEFARKTLEKTLKVDDHEAAMAGAEAFKNGQNAVILAALLGHLSETIKGTIGSNENRRDHLLMRTKTRKKIVTTLCALCTHDGEYAQAYEVATGAAFGAKAMMSDEDRALADACRQMSLPMQAPKPPKKAKDDERPAT
jgi:hypothetical protein